MKKTKWLNEEPFKEKECPNCHKILRQTRVRLGKNGLKAYRIWVHKETRKRACYEEQLRKSPYLPRPSNHKVTCKCGECKRTMDMNVEIAKNLDP